MLNHHPESKDLFVTHLPTSAVRQTRTLILAMGVLTALTGCNSTPTTAEHPQGTTEAHKQAQPSPSTTDAKDDGAKADGDKANPVGDKAKPADKDKPAPDGALQVTFEGKPVTIATAIATRPYNSEHTTILELYEIPSTCDERAIGKGLFIKMPITDLIAEGKTPEKGFSKIEWQGETLIKDDGFIQARFGEASFFAHDYVSVIKSFKADDEQLQVTVDGFKAKPNDAKATFEHVLTIDGDIEAKFCPPNPKDQAPKTRGPALKATVKGTDIEFKQARLITDFFGSSMVLLSVNPMPCSADRSITDDVFVKVVFTKEGKPEYAQIEGHRLFGMQSFNAPDDVEINFNPKKMSLELSSDIDSTFTIKRNKIAVTDCRKKKDK